ncbi:hypothetical protein E8E13_001295 [Curvularia kusanoi]|uniref:Uncharacterized protein n=1 Tax=Curvularia kusanoi TaxID=90978 RepID=A0A9P4W3Y3_CURKU|nr:hypothetical protein E8E13_001295 [Curvularia kusanoi]
MKKPLVSAPQTLPPGSIGYESLMSALAECGSSAPELLPAVEFHSSIMGKSICDDYKALKYIVTHKEDAVINHWREMSSEQRRQTLLTVYPQILHSHHCDYELYGDILARARNSTQVAKSLDPMRWPYLNTVDLQRVDALPMYIRARGRNAPWNFALSELQHCSFHTKRFQTVEEMTAWMCEALEDTKDNIDQHEARLDVPDTVQRMSGFVVQFTEKPFAKSYGRVTDVSSRSKINSVDLPVWHGLQTLRTQQHIYRFLLGCCRHLCQVFKIDLSAPSLPKASTLVRLPPGIDKSQSSFADAAALAPYQSTTSIDVSRLVNYVEAMANESNDHIVALREDHENLDQYVRTCWEHQSATKPGECQSHTFKAEFIRRILTEIITEAFFLADVWHELHARLSSIGDIDQTLPISDAQLDRIIELEDFTGTITRKLVNMTYRKWSASPTKMKQSIQHAMAGTVPVYSDALQEKIEDNPMLYRGALSVFRIFEETLSAADESSRTAACLYSTLHRLDTLIRTDPIARSTVSAYTAMSLSQLSIQNFPSSLQKLQTPLSSNAETVVVSTQPQALSPTRTAPSVPIFEPTRQEPTAATPITEPLISAVKTKKTKRKAQSESSISQPASEPPPHHHLASPHPPRTRPTFPLTSRDHTVFRSLFHIATPKSSGPAKAIKWKDFQRAMCSVGFGAEKLMGSAWQFWPGDALKALGVTGKVQIHEPHPEHELRATEARKFGRRLFSQYGWDGDMFELA